MVRKKAETREDLNSFKEEMIHQFHLFSVGLVDQIKQVAEGVANINEKLDRFREEIKNQVEERFGILSQGIAGVSKKLAETRETLSGEIEEVRRGLNETRQELKETREELKNDVEEVRQELNKEIQEVHDGLKAEYRKCSSRAEKGDSREPKVDLDCDEVLLC
jgi:uncharacterized phage infection (PIP) family protein YhgE